MEKMYVVPVNGAELQKQDLDMLGEVAGRADDRVLWELLRLLPGSATPQKGIVPYGVSGWGDPLNGTVDSNAFIVGGTSDAKLKIQPFRAVVGSATLFATSPIENLRGIKSGYLVGGSNLWTSITVAANAAGNPRWTLVYATVTPDTNDSAVTRYKKDPTTEVVTSASYVVNKKCAVVINQLDGAAAASPMRPALPADGGGSYNIALAYVWVPNGFGAASAVVRESIYELAPCLSLNSAMGAPVMAPANGSFASGGAVDTRQTHQQLKRPGAYLPSTMVGGEKRLIVLQRGLSPLSHNDQDVVDDSVDWRNRHFQWRVIANGGTATTDGLASDRNATGNTPAGSAIGVGANGPTAGTDVVDGYGQSFVNDCASGAAFSPAISDGNGFAVYTNNNRLSELGASTTIALYVRTDGKLAFRQLGTGTFQAIVWLEATAPYANFGTI